MNKIFGYLGAFACLVSVILTYHSIISDNVDYHIELTESDWLQYGRLEKQLEQEFEGGAITNNTYCEAIKHLDNLKKLRFKPYTKYVITNHGNISFNWNKTIYDKIQSF